MKKVQTYESEFSLIVAECPYCGKTSKVNVDWIDDWVFSALETCDHLDHVEVTRKFKLNQSCGDIDSVFYLVFNQ